MPPALCTPLTVTDVTVLMHCGGVVITILKRDAMNMAQQLNGSGVHASAKVMRKQKGRAVVGSWTQRMS